MKKKEFIISPSDIDKDKRDLSLIKKKTNLDRLKSELTNKKKSYDERLDALIESKNKRIELLQNRKNTDKYNIQVKKIELKYEEELYSLNQNYRIFDLEKRIEKNEEMLDSDDYIIPDTQESYSVSINDKTFNTDSYYSIFLLENDSLISLHDLGWKSTIFKGRLEILVEYNGIPDLDIKQGYEGVGDVQYEVIRVDNPVDKKLVVFYEDMFS